MSKVEELEGQVRSLNAADLLSNTRKTVAVSGGRRKC